MFFIVMYFLILCYIRLYSSKHSIASHIFKKLLEGYHVLLPETCFFVPMKPMKSIYAE